MTKAELFELAEHNSDAAFVVRSDGAILYWSGRAERLFGFSRSQACGKRCFDLLDSRTADGAGFCSAHCPVLAALSHREAAPTVDVEVSTAGVHAKWVSLSTMQASVASERAPVILHVCRELHGDLQIAALAKRAYARVSELCTLISEAGPAEQAVVLSQREREVLQLAADGFTARRTADKLGIAPATVRNHIRNILEKLGRHTKIGAVTEARKRGLL